ncbi:MAG: hypothetical protein Q9164_006645, partial [Protoblastenia rupestris]
MLLDILLPALLLHAKPAWTSSSRYSNSTTTKPLLGTGTNACTADCVRSNSAPYASLWFTLNFTATITAETVVNVVNTKRNTTRTTTITNSEADLSNYTAITDTNSAGTRTYLVTDVAPDGSGSTTFPVAFPTVYFKYNPSYTVEGVLPTTVSGTPTCLSIGDDGQGSVLTYSTHPPIPFSTQFSNDKIAEDPKGLTFGLLGSYGMNYDAQVQPLFPDLGVWSCAVNDTFVVASAAFSKTALYLTDTTTSLEEDNESPTPDPKLPAENPLSVVEVAPTIAGAPAQISNPPAAPQPAPGSPGPPQTAGSEGGTPSAIPAVEEPAASAGQAGNPGHAGNPGQAGNPKQADSPGQAGNPGQADSPGQAGNPGQAGSLEQAGNPGQNGNNGQPNSPGQASGPESNVSPSNPTAEDSTNNDPKSPPAGPGAGQPNPEAAPSLLLTTTDSNGAATVIKAPAAIIPVPITTTENGMEIINTSPSTIAATASLDSVITSTNAVGSVIITTSQIPAIILTSTNAQGSQVLTTSPLPTPPPTNAIAAPPITINGQTITPNPEGQYIVSGQTLSPGGSPITVGSGTSGTSGTSIALQTSGGNTVLVIGD